jgi:hypothetical protein
MLFCILSSGALGKPDETARAVMDMLSIGENEAATMGANWSSPFRMGLFTKGFPTNCEFALLANALLSMKTTGSVFADGKSQLAVKKLVGVIGFGKPECFVEVLLQIVAVVGYSIEICKELVSKLVIRTLAWTGVKPDEEPAVFKKGELKYMNVVFHRSRRASSPLFSENTQRGLLSRLFSAIVLFFPWNENFSCWFCVPACRNWRPSESRIC